MKKISENLKCAIMLILICIITANSSIAKAGAINGIDLCIKIIIPSLLPILILTSALSKSYCRVIINRLFSKITVNLFHLPKEAAAPIIFGLIGGYPTGAILTKDAYDTGLLTEKDAKRIMHFNICPGLAFTVNAVGSLYNDNGKTGIIIYLIILTSSLLIGITEGLINKKHENPIQYIKCKNIGEAFSESVNETKNNLLIMSCYIILFSAVANLFDISDLFNPFLEITNGLFSPQKRLPFSYICFFLGFGGFCIHFQIMGILKDLNIKYYEILISRIIGALLCYFPGKAYTLLNNQSIEVFSNISYAIPKENDFGKGLSILFLFGSIIIIYDIKNKKSKLL